MKRNGWALASAVIAVCVLAQPLFAQKVFLDKFKEAYPGVADGLAKCTTCHTPAGGQKPNKKNINAYGKELQGEAKAAMDKAPRYKYTEDDLKAVLAGIKAIGAKDSNGNGKTNDEDIKAGTNPGVK